MEVSRTAKGQKHILSTTWKQRRSTKEGGIGEEEEEEARDNKSLFNVLLKGVRKMPGIEESDNYRRRLMRKSGMQTRRNHGNQSVLHLEQKKEII